MQNFDNVPIKTGYDFQTVVKADNSAAVVEQSRAVSEVQSAIIVSKKFPRDEQKAYTNIITACRRKNLAEQSAYAFKRGGTLVTGPTIRIAEVLARCYGNLDYGFREIGRKGDSSEVQAYCWDMENNVRASRTFLVKHFRDTKSGSKKLSAERDKYEHIASQAQRRVRACILEMIPGDIVDGAMDECKKTIEAGDGRPIEDRVRGMLAAFKDVGVTQEMVEGFLQHKVSAIVPSQLVTLNGMFRSIRDGVAKREELFNLTRQKPIPKYVHEKLKIKEPQPEKEKPKLTCQDENEMADWMIAIDELPQEIVKKVMENLKINIIATTDEAQIVFNAARKMAG